MKEKEVVLEEIISKIDLKYKESQKGLLTFCSGDAKKALAESVQVIVNY